MTSSGDFRSKTRRTEIKSHTSPEPSIRRKKSHSSLREHDQAETIRLGASSDSDYDNSMYLRLQSKFNKDKYSNYEAEDPNVKSPSIILEFIMGNLSRCFGGLSDKNMGYGYSHHNRSGTHPDLDYRSPVLPKGSKWHGMNEVNDTLNVRKNADVEDNDLYEKRKLSERAKKKLVRRESKRNIEDDIILNTQSTDDSKQRKYPKGEWDLVFLPEDPSMLRTWSSSYGKLNETGNEEIFDQVSPTRVKDVFSCNSKHSMKNLIVDQIESYRVYNESNVGEDIFRRNDIRNSCTIDAKSPKSCVQGANALVKMYGSLSDDLPCDADATHVLSLESEVSIMPLFNMNQVDMDRSGNFVLITEHNNNSCVKLFKEPDLPVEDFPSCFVSLQKDDNFQAFKNAEANLNNDLNNVDFDTNYGEI